MRQPRLLAAVLCCAAGLLAAPAGAQAAARCAEPGGQWQRANPAQTGMDAAKLQAALDYGTQQLGFALRVYRHGCLVAEDRLAPTNRTQRYESWSMAKSVTALMFGRAMQLGLVSPDDPVGSLLPEADRAHGAITMRDLLTQTSGLEWNGFRDYNVFTMPDRVRDALTLGVVRPRGTYFEYAQSPVALLAEAVGRSAGQDAGAFVQGTLMDPLGIPASSWRWNRDPAGHIEGFKGVQMRPDDFGRLGDLMRRKGTWRGKRLLASRFMREAIAPTKTNGCYGWLIWVNAGAPCVGPTITERPVEPGRDFPDLPADMYRFSGLFGQLVTVFPGQDIVVVRTGQDRSLVFSGGENWEHELYKRVLGAVTDQRIPQPGPPRQGRKQQNADYGFQTALGRPDQYSKGANPAPLPPAGPERARAPQLSLARSRASRKGVIAIRLRCPPRWPGKTLRSCSGRARLQGAKKKLRYRVTAGRSKVLRFRITKKRLRAMRRKGRTTHRVLAVNRDSAGGTPARITATVRKPARKKR